MLKKLWKNCRGAVTVMVTLLLIPSILVTGTGVDIARIYTARSILQDANQLAANSALASYSALLQDIYGLYGIAQTEDAINTLADGYVQTAVSGGAGGQALGENTAEFALFNGGTPTVSVTVEPGQNLANPDVLRRQIEEYTLLRGPIIIAQEVLERLESFQKMKADAAVIDKKMAVEDQIEDIDEIYQQIYLVIQAVEGYNAGEERIFKDVNKGLDHLYDQFRAMMTVRDEYDTIRLDSNSKTYMIDRKIDQYQDIAGNIAGVVMGPAFGENWQVDDNNDGDSDHGSFKTHNFDQINIHLINGQDDADAYKQGVELLNQLCQDAEKKKDDLEKAICELEEELNKDKCSSELKNGITQPQGGASKSMLQEYKDLVQYDLGQLGQEYANRNLPQIQAFKELLDSLLDGGTPLYVNGKVAYRNTYLRSFNESTFDINSHLNPAQQSDPLADAIWSMPLPISNPNDGYKSFQEISTKHMAFYEELKAMYENSSDGSKGSDKEKSVKSNITSLFKALKELFGSIIPNPDGAHHYTAGTDDSGNTTGSNFAGAGKDWGDNDKIKSDLKSSLNSSLISKLGDMANSIGNKMLLMAYATEMFSCYSTGRGSDTDPKTMSGVPLGLDINYYYQSELEYIYNGNLSDAIANVNSLGSMLLLIRFVFDYVVSFSVTSVNNTVNAVRTSLAFLGPIAVGIAELARMGLALGEALTDLSLLRNGHKIALIKDGKDYIAGGDWHFSLSGLAGITADVVAAEIADAESAGSALDDDHGLYYFDYVRIFLLFVDGDDMAERISNLIGLNMTNKTNNLGAIAERSEREAAMTAATKFDMSKAVTGFSITTTAELRMLFLSMSFAQNAFDGIVPPQTLTVSATDYRGY